MEAKKIHCNNCGITDYQIIEKSGQKTAWCVGCGAWIKNIPFAEPAYYFGRYAGKLVKDVDDEPYMRWFLQNVKGNKRTKAAIELKLYG